MSIFANKKDLEAAKSQIDSLQGDITTLEAELATERETVATQAQSIADLQSSFDALATERDNLTASLTLAMTQICQQIVTWFCRTLTSPRFVKLAQLKTPAATVTTQS